MFGEGERGRGGERERGGDGNKPVQTYRKHIGSHKNGKSIRV